MSRSNIKYTNSEVHDSQPTEKLLRDEDKGQELYAGRVYIGKPIEDMLQEKGIIPQIIERAFKGKPLNESCHEPFLRFFYRPFHNYPDSYLPNCLNAFNRENGSYQRQLN